MKANGAATTAAKQKRFKIRKKMPKSVSDYLWSINTVMFDYADWMFDETCSEFTADMEELRRFSMYILETYGDNIRDRRFRQEELSKSVRSFLENNSSDEAVREQME